MAKITRSQKFIVVIIFGFLMLIGLGVLGVTGFGIWWASKSQELANPNWKEYTDVRSGSAISFPAEPNKKEQEIKVSDEINITQVSYEADGLEESYVLIIENLPVEDVSQIGGSEKLLELFSEKMVVSQGAQVLTNNMIEQQGLQGKEVFFSISKYGATGYMKGRILVGKKAVYLFYVVSSEKTMKNYDRFINSFRLL